MHITINVNGNVLNFEKNMDYDKMLRLIDRLVMMKFKTNVYSIWTAIDMRSPKPFKYKLNNNEK